MTPMDKAVTGVGAAFMLLSAFPLGDYFFKKDPSPAASYLRVGVGMARPNHPWLDEQGLDLGGNAPGVALFDPSGNRIGFQSGTTLGTIYAGRHLEIVIEPLQKGNNVAPEYMSVVAGGSDSICINYLTLTAPDLKPWYIYGDILKECGAKWYHSNALTKEDQTFRPKCFWIGGPKEDTGRPYHDYPEGVGFHLPSFDDSDGRRQQYDQHPETLCNSKPRLHLYSQLSELTCLPIFDPPLELIPGGGDLDFKRLHTQGRAQCSPSANDLSPLPDSDEIHKLRKYRDSDDGSEHDPTYGVKKRANGPKRGCMHSDRLIESPHPGHTASELCQDPKASGPDFVSYDEGLMCDMCTRVLWPLCSERMRNGCFDTESKQIRPATGIGANSTLFPRDIVPKAYKKVEAWT